jgi:hypothetical protein
MNYKLIQLKPISKFNILEFNRDKGGTEWERKHRSLSGYFWSSIFDEKILNNFIEKKFTKYKNKKIDSISYKSFSKEYKFVLEKLLYLNKKIDFRYSKNVPNWEDIFFSYRIFNKILSYYNEFYFDSYITFDLKKWLLYHKDLNTIEDYFHNLDYFYKTDLIQDLIKPYVLKFINSSSNENIVYKLDIFWPEELITIWLISKILKDNNKNIKIIVDFSMANEQLDFSQWIELIKNSWTQFFDIVDFFTIYRDYWKWNQFIIDYLNWKLEMEDMNNVIYYDNWVKFNYIEEQYLNSQMIDSFIKDTFNKKNISKIMWSRSIYARFLPYKCYWNKCNFCAINSQNKIIYDNKYSYNFFIDKWINFIEENNIWSLNFKDEAMIPTIIIAFAQKIVNKWLKINYQFRTRYDKLYTFENCKILYKSWARFCWMWLESAVERINEEIWNKWNNGIKLNDKVRIIHNFDKAWISVHNYSIIWFPGETDKESASTYQFLKTNIIKSNFFTCTPNTFWLMRWPKIFIDREKLWIEINKEELDIPFRLIYEFKYKWKERNLWLLKKFQSSLHNCQFTPWIAENNQEINFRDFWDYIDRSYIFYLLKRYHNTNPFYIYKGINNEILTKNISEILNSFFNVSNYYQIFEYKNDSNIYIYDWVWSKDTIINNKYKSFIINYNSNFSLLDNIKICDLKIDNSFEKIIYLLLRDKLLYFKSFKK